MTVQDGFHPDRHRSAGVLGLIIVRGLWRPPRVKHPSDQGSGSVTLIPLSALL
jgi:hypothetical protein